MLLTRRWMSVVLVAGLILGVFSSDQLAYSDTATIYVSDDCSASVSYGLTAAVTFHGNWCSEDVKTFWKFDLSQLAVPSGSTIEINSAFFRLHTESSYGTVPTDTVYQVLDNSWTAGAFTLAGAPAFGPALGTYTYAGLWGQVSVDCKDYLQSVLNGQETLISFGSQATNISGGLTDNYFRVVGRRVLTEWSWAGTEYAAYVPKLEIDYTITTPPQTSTPAPVITPGGDSEGYTASITVTITDSEPTAMIRYTTDGTDPTESSPIYTDPFTVNKTTVVKAKAWATGMTESAMAKATYQFAAQGTKVISVAMEDTSITPYHNFGSLHVMFLGNWYTGYDVQSYLKFTVPEIAKPSNGQTIIHSAIFKWYTGDSGHEPGNTPPPATLYTVNDNSWSETATTFWGTVPFGTALEVFEFKGPYLPLYFDVTSFIQDVVDNGDTTFSFGAEAPNTYVDENHINSFRMFSREIASTYPNAVPQLIIDYTIDVPRVAKPMISPAGGAFLTDQTVTMTCDTVGAEIRYTDDGSEPTESSTLYTAPFTVVGPKLIQAIAFPPAQSELYMSEGAVAMFDATPTAFNNPVEIKQTTAAIVCDGDLTEWANVEWAAMNENYDGNPTDILQAYYAAKWAPDGSKIYVAVKVKDSTHVFTDTYYEWDARDAVEIYLHTNGYSDNYTFGNSVPAQQYTIGVTNSNRNAVWTNIGYKTGVPAVCEFEAGGKEVGDWLYYEVAMKPFQYMGGVLGMPSISTPVVAGQVIGLDVAAAGNNGVYTGMKAENLLQWKSEKYTKFGLHKLVASAVQTPGDANNDGMVDVGDLGILAANYGGSGKTWAQGDFNGDGLVDVGDLGILAANYGTGNFAADYAKAFGTVAEEDDSALEEDGPQCFNIGLPLIAGLLLAGLMLVKLEE